MIYFFVLLMGLLTTPIPANPESEWDHPFANRRSSAFLEFPFTETNIQNFLNVDSIRIPSVLENLLCADLDQDGIQEVIGQSVDRDNIYFIDFTIQSIDTIPIIGSPKPSIYLSALVDVDNDHLKDVLYSAYFNGKTEHRAYSVLNESHLFQIPGKDGTANEKIFTAVDINYDGSLELITYENTENANSFVRMYDISRKNHETTIDFPAPISPAVMAITQDDLFKESYLILAATNLPDLSQSTSSTSIYAYLFSQESDEPVLLWEQPIRSDLFISRLAIGQSNSGDPIVIAGTALNQNSDASIPRSVFLLDLFDGRFIREFVLQQEDCLTLSVGNWDEDVESEIVFFTSGSNLNWMNPSQNRVRVFTVLNAEPFSGAANMQWNSFAEIPTVQKVGERFILYIFTEDLSTAGIPPYYIPGTLKGTPILGDTDGNRAAEVIFVTENQSSFLNRIYFNDPNIIPAPTPTSVNSAVENWKIH